MSVAVLQLSVAAAAFRGVVEWMEASSSSARGSRLLDLLLVVEGSRRRAASLCCRFSKRPRAEEVDARGSPVARKGESEGSKRTEALLPLICIEGMTVWMPVASRLAFRSSGKRDVSVDRRRSVGGFSLVCAAAGVFCSRTRSDWLRIDPPETARCGRGRDWAAVVVVVLLLGVSGALGLGALRREAEGSDEDTVRGR